MAATLDTLRKGQSARLTAIRGDGALTQRILALGLLPGTVVTVIGIAPMGDPITVCANVGQVSIRRGEASALEIEPLPNPLPQKREAAL